MMVAVMTFMRIPLVQGCGVASGRVMPPVSALNEDRSGHMQRLLLLNAQVQGRVRNTVMPENLPTHFQIARARIHDARFRAAETVGAVLAGIEPSVGRPFLD